MSNALNDVIVVSLDVRIWSGRKKLRPEDLTTSGRLPPKDLVSLGSKKIFDPKALKPFADVKRKAETRCQAIGVRFARAFAIPKAAAKSVVEELNGLAENFKQVRDAFLATYDEELTRWKDAASRIRAIDRSGAVAQSPRRFEVRVRLRGVRDQCGARRRRTRRADGAGRCRQPHPGTCWRALPGGGELNRESSCGNRSSGAMRSRRNSCDPCARFGRSWRDSPFWTRASRRWSGSIDEVLAAVPRKGKISGTVARGATRRRDPADGPGQDARARPDDARGKQ